LTTIATGLKNAIDANAGLIAAGITATSAGTAITIKSTSANATTYSQSTSAGATETISLSINQNSPQTIALAGTKTTGDTITVTVYDAGLTGELKAVTYTVLAGDTLTSIAINQARRVLDKKLKLDRRAAVVKIPSYLRFIKKTDPSSKTSNETLSTEQIKVGTNQVEGIAKSQANRLPTLATNFMNFPMNGVYRLSVTAFF